MSQSQRIKEMEQYIKKLGDLLNIIYKKMGDAESKVSSLEMEVSRVKGEVEALKAQNMQLRGNSVEKTEYEEFTNRLIEGLRGLLPESSQGTST